MIRIVDAITRLNTVGVWITALSIGGMGIITIVDVAKRYLQGSSLPGTVEALQLLMVVAAMMAMGYCQIRKGHVRVDILLTHLSVKWRLILESLAWLLFLIFSIILVWRTFEYGWDSWVVREFTAGYIRFPMYPSKLLIPVGISLLSLTLLVDFTRSLRDTLVEFTKEKRESN